MGDQEGPRGDRNVDDQIADHARRLSRLEDQTSEIGVIKANHANLVQIFERTERIMVTAVADLRKAMEKGFESLDHAINGNGKTGLVEQVAGIDIRLGAHLAREETIATDVEDLKSRQQLEDGRRAGEEAVKTRFWRAFTPFIPYIAIIFAAAGGYYFGFKGGTFKP